MVDGRNDGRRNLKIVGEENESLIDIGGVKADAPKQGREFCGRVLAAQSDGLIAADAGRWINGVRMAAPKIEIMLGAENKVGEGLVKAIQAREVDIATIHDNEASRLRNETIQDL